jgi:hypothetical protein
MARSISHTHQFQGTIGGVTYVNSKKYGLHIRAKKGTYTPIVVTASMQESMGLLQQCNQQARPLFQALRDEYHDSGLWSRLVSLFYKELKAGRKFSVDCLRNLECNITYKLQDILPKEYTVVVKKEKKKMGIEVRLSRHPKAEDQAPRDGYHLRLVVLYPDFIKGTCRKEEATGPLTKYNAGMKALDLEVPMPSAKAPYIVLMCVIPIVTGEPMFIVRDSGMRVVAVG